jgi:hypothetical protein
MRQRWRKPGSLGGHESTAVHHDAPRTCRGQHRGAGNGPASGAHKTAIRLRCPLSSCQASAKAPALRTIGHVRVLARTPSGHGVVRSRPPRGVSSAPGDASTAPHDGCPPAAEFCRQPERTRSGARRLSELGTARRFTASGVRLAQHSRPLAAPGPLVSTDGLVVRLNRVPPAHALPRMRIADLGATGCSCWLRSAAALRWQSEESSRARSFGLDDSRHRRVQRAETEAAAG